MYMFRSRESISPQRKALVLHKFDVPHYIYMLTLFFLFIFNRSHTSISPERKALVLHKYDVPQMASTRAVATAQMPPPSYSTYNVLDNVRGDKEALDPWFGGPRITYDALTDSIAMFNNVAGVPSGEGGGWRGPSSNVLVEMKSTGPETYVLIRPKDAPSTQKARPLYEYEYEYEAHADTHIHTHTHTGMEGI